MNITPLLIALAMAAIGAALYLQDSIGLGIALIVCAAVVSQTTTLSNIWWRYVYRRYNGGQNLAPQKAAVDGDMLESAVSEIEESSVDTRSFLKNFKTAWHQTDVHTSPHRNKKEM